MQHLGAVGPLDPFDGEDGLHTVSAFVVMNGMLLTPPPFSVLTINRVMWVSVWPCSASRSIVLGSSTMAWVMVAGSGLVRNGVSTLRSYAA